MKWFKHYTDSLDDPFIHALIDKFGPVGYLAYFGIIEIICKENGVELSGKLDVNPTYLRRKLRTSQGKLRLIYAFCQGLGKLSVSFSEEKWSFYFPKIAKIKDNYTKDLQGTNKEPFNYKEKEKEKEEDKEYSQSSDELRLATLLLNKILERKSDYKKPNLQKWAEDIDKAIRIDKRKPKTIEKVIVWVQGNDFWQDNILSTQKLRKQFDKLELEMDKDQKNFSATGTSDKDEAYDAATH